MSEQPLVDIHCHLLPLVDDGARSWDESLAMAQMAVEQGVQTVIATPHQLGNYTQNRGDDLRVTTRQLQELLVRHDVPLRVLPGADVRIEPDMIDRLQAGDVLTLADRGKHVLLELPHELYFPIDGVLNELHRCGMVGVLSHPERNQGLLNDRELVEQLVDIGCLMQVTAGSLAGTFGPQSQEMATWMVQAGLVHFVATDAHGIKSRRPLLGRAWQQLERLCGAETATLLCAVHPAAVAWGQDVPSGRWTLPMQQAPRPVPARRSWFGWKAAF